MHPVLDKMKMRSFDGLFDVHGTEREVAFVSADDGEQSVLAIRGLSLPDALHVLDRLHGGLLKGKDAENPKTNGVKAAAPAKPAPVKVVEVVAEPEEEEEEEEEEVEPADVDIAAMAKMEKLRPVIEHLVSRGFKTAKAIAEVAESIKDQIPALMEVDKKGDFGRRMDRAAMVVLGHE